MTFKENTKTAIAKVLSDIIQCDGMVNQGEINYLRQVFRVLKINDSHLKKSGLMSLSEAVNILGFCGYAEKATLLYVIQQLTASDDNIDPSESLLLCAVLLSIDMELPETKGLKAHIVTIPNTGFDPRGTVIYVESIEHEETHHSIEKEHPSISMMLEQRGCHFCYLPHIIKDIQRKGHTFKQMLTYLEPLLSEEQLMLIENDLKSLNSSALSKEIFIHYLNDKGFHIDHPAFLFKIDNLKPNQYQDFLILDISGDPLQTLNSFFILNDTVMKIQPVVKDKNYQKRLKALTMSKDAHGTDAFLYTGFHKIIIDTLLKYHSDQRLSRLRISSNGHLFLVDRNEAEVKIQSIGRALYILYLRHEEGIALTNLIDYREELMGIYAMTSDYNDEKKLRTAVDNLVNSVGNTISPMISRIKRAFTALLGEQAKDYLIDGNIGEPKKIHLDRRMILDEFH